MILLIVVVVLMLIAMQYVILGVSLLEESKLIETKRDFWLWVIPLGMMIQLIILLNDFYVTLDDDSKIN